MSLASIHASVFSKNQIENYISELVEKIKAINSECTIYLFGSALTDRFTAASDIDLCVVLPNSQSCKKMSDDLYAREQFSTLIPVDLLIFNAAYFNKKSEIGGVCFQVKKTGKIIYQGRPHEPTVSQI